jgi:hypothetical protein
MEEDVPVSECVKGGQCDYAPVVPADKLARYEVSCTKCGRTIDVEGPDPADPVDRA